MIFLNEKEPLLGKNETWGSLTGLLWLATTKVVKSNSLVIKAYLYSSK